MTWAASTRAFAVLARAGFHRYATYRAATIAGAFTVGLVERVGARRLLVVDLTEPVAVLSSALAGIAARAQRDDELGLRHTVTFAPGEVSAALVLERLSQQYAIHDLSLAEPDIEDVVRRLYLSGQGG